jgi:hypothetical protein
LSWMKTQPSGHIRRFNEGLAYTYRLAGHVNREFD